MIHNLLLVFLFSLIVLLILHRLAPRIGLVDKPNTRKHHQGVIPLVGGLSVYAGICCYLFTISLYDQTVPDRKLYLICSSLLVIIGSLDDRFDISVKLRAIIQAMIAISMVATGFYLKTLGYLLGAWELKIGHFGYLLTLLAVWAAINAFNMIDGIDGLLSGVSCVTFASLAIVFLINHKIGLAGWCLASILALLPYSLLNLGVLGQRYKVFMGDAGSTLIGFTVFWLLIQSTQMSYPAEMQPVTALWLIAIPLIDMVAIMYRRLRKGISPFTADRQHIHHLLMQAGFSHRQVLVLIVAASMLLAAIGLIGEYVLYLSDDIMLALFLLLFFLYGYCMRQAPRLARIVNNTKRKDNF